MEYEGRIIEMGNIQNIDEYNTCGLVVDTGSMNDLASIGFTERNIKSMPNLLYKKVKITINVLE